MRTSPVMVMGPGPAPVQSGSGSARIRQSTSRYTVTTTVDSKYHQTVINYIVWQYTNWSRLRSLTEKRIAKQEYYAELRKSRARTFGFTKGELLNVIRVNTTMTPNG